MTRRQRRILGHLGRYAALGLWLVIILFPIFWSVMTSFKPQDEWLTWPPTWFPSVFTLENYSIVWRGASTAGTQTANPSAVQSASLQTPLAALVHSGLIAGTSTLLSVAFGVILAYSVSRYQIIPEQRLFNLLMLRMIPPIVVAVPLVMYYSTIKLRDTHAGLILVYTITTLPYAVWMAKSFIDEIPLEIEHAAYLLKASRLRTLREVIFPLIRPGVVATFLFILILTWSEYLLALVLSATNVSTLPVQLNKYEGATEGKLYGWQAALSVGVTFPLIIIGYLIHKHLVRGFSFGMLKR